MDPRNLEFYNCNEQRSYPIDDTAQLVDDRGLRLPHDLIVDLYLLFPQTLGDRSYLSSITAGPNIVTATFVVDSPDFMPLATISLPQPVVVGKQYNLESQAVGAGGWIVFGSGIQESTRRSYRFSTAVQSKLVLQAARRYSPAPVRSLGKLAVSQQLTGIVKLSGGDDLEVVKEEREIAGIVRDVAVVRLKDKSETGSRNLFDVYKGRCNRRPESRNCGEPDPIEFLNSVSPDCCGRIYVEMRGCAEISTTQTDGCGVVIDCSIGLNQACVTPDRLPTADGTLPNEYVDICVSESVP